METVDGAVRPKTGDLFERTFNTSTGPIDLLAEVVVEGDAIHLKDRAIFATSAEPLTGLTKEVFAARTQLAGAMKQLGVIQLRMTGKRIASSSSVYPSKEIDITIDLTRG